MPMNVARLEAYIRNYDVDLDASWVAMDGKIIFGLGMLGVRPDRAWITRVGVLPIGRRQGTGRAIVNQLIASAEELGCREVWIEVIVGNEPARQLFLTSGFVPTRELLVARRPPSHTSPLSAQGLASGLRIRVGELNRSEILDYLERQVERANWLNERESFQHAAHVKGMLVDIEGGGRGWVVYQSGEFQLSHIVLEVLKGDPAQVTASVLRALHRKSPTQDAVMENLPTDSAYWPGFLSVGYFEAFRRTEMVKQFK
ncbi:MAG: GNAT family N-acetyltransferase [Chloroflexota bacterium]